MNEAAVPAPKSRPQPLGLVLGVLLVVYVLNFLDRQIVNILAEPIRRDLDLSDTQIGLMTGIAFAAFYTFLGIPIARFADKPTTNRVGLIAGALVIWSGMTALCGQAQSFLQLLLARIGVGVGEAGCSPAAHSLIADLAPPEKRASAMAIYALGIPVGTLLGMLIGGLLADAYGWRMAFVVVGLPGVLLAGAVILLLRDPRRAAAMRAATAAQPLRTLSNREALAKSSARGPMSCSLRRDRRRLSSAMARRPGRRSSSSARMASARVRPASGSASGAASPPSSALLRGAGSRTVSARSTASTC
jgi:predicted MFS family arabinose efflux permease